MAGIKTTVTVDASVWNAKLRTMRQRDIPAGSLAALKELAHLVAKGWFQRTPRDTNRYVAAIAQANNEAGLETMGVPALKESRFSENIRQQVFDDIEESERLIKKWDRAVEGHKAKFADFQSRAAAGLTKPRRGRRPKKWKAQKEAEKFLRWAIERRDNAIEQLLRIDEAPGGVFGSVNFDLGAEEFGERIFFRRGGGKKTKLGLAKSLNVRVIPGAFGGTGRTFQAGGQWFVELSIFEPHARFVERKTRGMRRSLALARRVGVKRAGRKFIQNLQQGALGKAA